MNAVEEAVPPLDPRGIKKVVVPSTMMRSVSGKTIAVGLLAAVALSLVGRQMFVTGSATSGESVQPTSQPLPVPTRQPLPTFPPPRLATRQPLPTLQPPPRPTFPPLPTFQPPPRPTFPSLNLRSPGGATPDP